LVARHALIGNAERALEPRLMRDRIGDGLCDVSWMWSDKVAKTRMPRQLIAHVNILAREADRGQRVVFSAHIGYCIMSAPARPAYVM
jgi:hypothetical protein